MRTRRRADDGFAEAAPSDFSRDPLDEALMPGLMAAIEKARGTTQRQHDHLAEARARTEVSRLAAEKKRRDAVRRWTKARAALFRVVAAADRALASEGMALSAIDTAVHPADLAGLDVRASILGRPVPAILQIVVAEDMKLLARIMYSERPTREIRLPAMAKMTVAAWIDAMLAYLEHAYPDPAHPPGRYCGRCGCYLPA